MDFKPIDVVKSQEVTQYKQYESHRTQQEQVQISKNFQNIIQQETSKTTQAFKSDNHEYRYDAKEKGNGSYSGSGSKKKKDTKENKTDISNPKKSGSIDIII